MFEHIMIDNYIVTKDDDSAIKITPITLFRRFNPNIDITTLPKLTLGHRIYDNSLLSHLSTGQLFFEDISNQEIVTRLRYPNRQYPVIYNLEY